MDRMKIGCRKTPLQSSTKDRSWTVRMLLEASDETHLEVRRLLTQERRSSGVAPRVEGGRRR